MLTLYNSDAFAAAGGRGLQNEHLLLIQGSFSHLFVLVELLWQNPGMRRYIVMTRVSLLHAKNIFPKHVLSAQVY